MITIINSDLYRNYASYCFRIYLQGSINEKYFQVSALFSVVFFVLSCGDKKSGKDGSNTNITLKQKAISFNECSTNKCDPTCFSPDNGTCIGRWTYPFSSLCYTEQPHPSCGADVNISALNAYMRGDVPSCYYNTHTTTGHSLFVCELGGERVEFVDTQIEVRTSLPADYMRYLYGVDSANVVMGMEGELTQYCSQDAMTEIRKVQEQCFPLTSDIGEPDSFLTNVLELFEVLSYVYDAMGSCQNTSSYTFIELLVAIAEKVPLDKSGAPHCVQQLSDMDDSLRVFMENDLQCSRVVVDTMIDQLFGAFYGRVKEKLEDVIDSQCSPYQNEVYQVILDHIESVADQDISSALTVELQRQCDQACREMLYYWKCAKEDEVNGQCPEGAPKSEKVFWADAQCDASVVEESISEELVDGARARATCNIIITAPEQYAELGLGQSSVCRAEHNGIDPGDSCTPEERQEKHLYSEPGLSREVAEATLLSNLDNPDSSKMYCLSGDDLTTWDHSTVPSEGEVHELHARLMSQTSFDVR